MSLASRMKDFMEANGLMNSIKSNNCFKGKGSCIDLILTNRKYSFKHSNSIETGISDHHHLIYTMLKTTFPKPDPKLVQYRKYKLSTLKVLRLVWEMLWDVVQRIMMILIRFLHSH